jgi:hypothetical protein
VGRERHAEDISSLVRDDDLLDAEFSAITERCGYPVVEIPIDAVTSAESDAGASCAAALKMYLGVPRLARAIRRR